MPTEERRRNFDRPHKQARGLYCKSKSHEVCACGFEATSIKEHVKEAELLTKEALASIDNADHISYWCKIHDHCCCTDSDWWYCNCPCHKDDPEEQHCHVRLMRWKMARIMASRILVDANPDPNPEHLEALEPLVS